MKVRLTLGALTRVEFSAVVDIPDNLTEDQKDDLVRKFYDEIDGGDYKPDPYYWEKGECYLVSMNDDELAKCSDYGDFTVDENLDIS